MPTYDPETAFLVVDVQNDFADPSGSLSVRDGADVVPVLNEQIRAAKAAGALVVFTADWHPASTPHFARDGGTWPVHCVQGTWGAAFHPRLEVTGPVVRKGSNGEDGYSGFTMRDPVSGETIATELPAMLAERGIRHVVVGGLATDYCVRWTVLDALRLGLRATVLIDAIRAVDLRPDDGDAALAEMVAAGAELEAAAGELGGDEAVTGAWPAVP
jgi:nicotinamidase/pyrazinamidase